MKISITNIDDFKPFLGKDDVADAAYDYVKKFGKIYGKSAKVTEAIDESLKVLSEVATENAPEKKTEDKPKKDNKGKSDKPKKKRKTGKKDTQNKKNKEKKPSKPKVGEVAPRQATLRRFASMCGKERTIASIRKFVKEIQANFSAKLKRKTPHIELIREIQTKLLKYANSGERKVSLPQWDDFKKQCQAAAREWTVSKTVGKPELKETSLSGLKKKRKKMCK